MISCVAWCNVHIRKKQAMKKLIIIAAVAMATIATQAAQFKWSTKTGQNVYLPGTTSSQVMSAYIFDSSAVSQGTMLAYFDANGAIDTSKALSTVSTSSDGKISNTVAGNEFSWGNAGDTLNAYFVIVTTIDDKDYLFISDIASAEGPGTGAGLLQYSAKTASQATAIEFAAGSASFSRSGWYTQSVPEPTSGLLLLLGMAGLALKRKQT